MAIESGLTRSSSSRAATTAGSNCAPLQRLISDSASLTEADRENQTGNRSVKGYGGEAGNLTQGWRSVGVAVSTRSAPQRLPAALPHRRFDDELMLVVLAFGERHPLRTWRPNVYQLAHRRLHGSEPPTT